jgi:hypothetical protein
MRVRAIFWTVGLAYTGFLLTGQGLQTFNSLSITEGFLGALTGFLLAIMFTLREAEMAGNAHGPALTVGYVLRKFRQSWTLPTTGRSFPPPRPIEKAESVAGAGNS